jgi:disulfide bond formation protein DsbB
MFIKKYGLYFSWLFATVGMIISLYFSDVKNFEPCHLCWFQRICLFPLCPILGIAAYRGFQDISRYLLPQVVFGLVLALYQVAIQEIPGWNFIEICGAGPSCSDKILIGLGPITIPMLSAFGFFLIGLTLSCVWIVNCRKSYTVAHS